MTKDLPIDERTKEFVITRHREMVYIQTDGKCGAFKAPPMHFDVDKQTLTAVVEYETERLQQALSND